MSRARNARRKAKRRQGQAAAEAPTPRRWVRSWRPIAFVPVLCIAAVLAAAALLGSDASDGKSQEQVREEVAALLEGLPQQGTTLGSPRAPITVWVFGDIECPTVKLFVESYLPSILDTWVRTGDVKLEYRSLQTDTVNEQTFFRQEIAALAAGRQDKMWNFLLTFVHQQGKQFSGYANDEFLTDIASQVPGLERGQWRRDRKDALLSKRVALGVYSAHQRGLSSTPAFLVGLSGGGARRGDGYGDETSLRREVEISFGKNVEALRKEAFKDAPTIGPFGAE